MTETTISKTGSTVAAGAGTSTSTTATNTVPAKGGAIDIGTFEDVIRSDVGSGMTGAQEDTARAVTTPPTPEKGGAIDIGLFDDGTRSGGETGGPIDMDRSGATWHDALVAEAPHADAQQDVLQHLLHQRSGAADTDGAQIDLPAVSTGHAVDIGMFDDGTGSTDHQITDGPLQIDTGV